MFDYLEKAGFAATVCDKDGIILYQNQCAVERDGAAVGKNLYNCHNKKSQEIIRRMIETGGSNTYEVVRNGKRRLLHQTPWYEKNSGEAAGLIEISISLPDEYPVFNRDLQK